MSEDEALAIFRARWNHPALDPRDVEERVALRLVDEAEPRDVVVIATPPACRLFVRREGWRSKYVHAPRDIDAALDELETMQ
jgi:hypothetical protein